MSHIPVRCITILLPRHVRARKDLNVCAMAVLEGISQFFCFGGFWPPKPSYYYSLSQIKIKIKNYTSFHS